MQNMIHLIIAHHTLDYTFYIQDSIVSETTTVYSANETTQSSSREYSLQLLLEPFM